MATDTISEKASTVPSMVIESARGMTACAERLDRTNRPVGDEHAGDCACGEREHDALGQHLQDQPQTAGAERGANRDLFAADRSSDEQQVGHIGTGDQDERADGRKNDEERRADMLDDVRVQTDHFGALIGARFRVLSGEPLGDGLHFTRCPIDGDPGLRRAITPRKCAPRVALAGFSASGRQNSDSPGNVKLGRHDTNDGDRGAIQADALSEDLRVAVEAPLPQAVAQDDDQSFPGTSSSARKVRPSAGATSRRSNRSDETSAPWTRSGPSTV